MFTDVNASGVNDGASTKLSWASIEIYSHWNPALGQEDRKYMDLQIVVDSFNYHSGDTDYSSHIGWVMLPEVNWNPTARNYARIVGHVKKNGQSCSDPVAIDFRQAAPWKKWFSFYPHDPNVHWPLRCVSYTGNLAVYHPVHNPNPTHEGWFDSGPLLPDDYQVTITHTDPQLGERPPVIAKLGVLTHDANTVIDVGKPNFGLPH